ncbi:MAG: sulfatase [Planctomycetota bacterium]
MAISAAESSDVRSTDDPPPPNILFIAVDDLACTLGCYGDLIAKTPNIDRLAANGICFQRAYNQLPLCNPTRASVMTGLRPDTIAVYDLDQHFRTAVPDAVTLPQAFAARGYRSARIGKIYHYNVPASIGTDGFDDPPSWQETINPKGRDKTDEHFVVNAEPHRKISAALSWLAADGTDAEQTDGMIATAAARWIKKNGDQPFFLGVGFFRPHTPYIAPKKYFSLYPTDQLRLPFAPANDRDDIPLAAFAHNCPVANYGLPRPTLLKAIQAYYACVSFIDAQIGLLMQSIQEQGIAENTIIVLWSDHGYHLGEHNGVWQKRTLFENSARSPLIIVDPRMNIHGDCHRIVEFVDIYPTVLQLAGVEPSTRLEGRSLVPLMRDPLASWNGMAVTQVLRPADDRLSQPVMGRSIRNSRYRLTQWGEKGAQGVELYDYHSDPGEFKNLAVDSSPQTREIMRALESQFQGKATDRVPSTPFNPARL